MSFINNLQSNDAFWVSAALLIWGTYKFLRALERFVGYGGVPYSKGRGVDAAMLCSMNLSVALVLITLLLGAFVRFDSIFDPDSPYVIAYAPLLVIIGVVALLLVASVYVWMFIKSLLNEYKTPLSLRLRTLHKYFSQRGVSEIELIVAPIVTLFVGSTAPGAWLVGAVLST